MASSGTWQRSNPVDQHPIQGNVDSSPSPDASVVTPDTGVLRTTSPSLDEVPIPSGSSEEREKSLEFRISLEEPGTESSVAKDATPARPISSSGITAATNTSTAVVAAGVARGGGPSKKQPSAGGDDTAVEVAEGVNSFINMDTCFKAFDKDEDGFLNPNEFGALCRALFRNERGKPYPVENSMLTTIFSIFDTNKDNVIDKDEFRYCWQNWIKQVVRPVTALLIVDVQNDFISGSLAIKNCPAGHDGEEVIPPINKLMEEVRFDTVVYSLDWHPEGHVSFIDNVQDRPLHKSCKLRIEDAQVYDTVVFENDGSKMEQKLWPKHCVQKTWGAELHNQLKVMEEAVFVYKGTDPETDSYSAFWDNNKKSHTNLHEELQKRHVTDVYVCGIAYDICVAATAKHAIEEGYRTLLIDDACRGVSEEDIDDAKQQIITNHGMVITSVQVKNLSTGRDRPPVLGFKLALELSKKMKTGTK